MIVFSFFIVYRPQFEGDVIPSAITGENMRYFPRDQYLYRVAFSVNVIAVLVMVVVGVVAGNEPNIFCFCYYYVI